MNRGFLRLPLLPLYGTDAVMMLWVSLPMKGNLLLVYLTGVIAAILLKYITGWGVGRLFKMEYWDYSSQRPNIKEYIYLSSSIVWGLLTIFLTEMVHRPIEHYVLGLPVMVSIVLVLITTLLFTADTTESVRTALDLAKVLDAMTDTRAELDGIQIQMVLLKAETSERVVETREEAVARLNRVRSGAASHTAAFEDDTAKRLNELIEDTMEKMSGFVEDTAEKVNSLMENTAEKVARTAERLSELTEDAAAGMSGTLAQRAEGAQQAVQRNELNEGAVQERRDKLAALSQHLVSISGKRHMLSNHMDFCHRGTLKGDPTAFSSRFVETLKGLREVVDRKDPDERRIK